MQGTRLLLARHAETSAPDRFHGAESDIGLSDVGNPAGRAARANRSRMLEPSRSTARRMRRAVDTAAAIGRACELEPIAIAALHERRIGPLSGLSREEGWAIYAASKQRWIAGDLEHTHPGGESYADIRRRVVPVFEELAARHSGADDHRRRPRRRDPGGPHQPARGLASVRLRPDRDRFRLGQRPVVRRHKLDGARTEPVGRTIAGAAGGMSTHPQRPGRSQTVVQTSQIRIGLYLIPIASSTPASSPLRRSRSTTRRSRSVT